MKLSSLLLPLSLSLSGASAQWDKLEQLKLLLTPKQAAEVVNPEPGVVYPVGLKNFRDVLQFTDTDWLVLFTTDTETCPGCGLYEKTFNDTVALLKDNKDIYFAMVDCNKDALLCSIFSSWGSRIFHVSHTKTFSKAFPGVSEHNTHVHPVPFHRPGTEGPPPNGKDPKAPPPAPDAKWISEVVNQGKWKEFSEWTGYSQPFEGYAQQPLFLWWWIVNLFSGIPPMAMMIVIGLLSRFVTARFTGKTLAPKQGPPAAAAAGPAGAAKRKTK
ncbi:hypothetical protein ABW20_dc0105885 [Dactylellina cionopaga]|nr:hypothetical protein ABW20_dc0105885 [Dactylellina cionopaga]